MERSKSNKRIILLRDTRSWQDNIPIYYPGLSGALVVEEKLSAWGRIELLPLQRLKMPWLRSNAPLQRRKRSERLLQALIIW